MHATMSVRSACLRFVRSVKDAMIAAGGHDSVNTRQLEIVKAVPGRIVTEYKIGPQNLNRARSIHGGMVSTLIDSVGSLAVASKGRFNTGISTDIHATFVRPAGGENDLVQAVGEVVNMGKTLAFTRVELRHPETQALLAYGSHTKYIRGSIGAKDNVVFDESGENVIEGELPTDA